MKLSYYQRNKEKVKKKEALVRKTRDRMNYRLMYYFGITLEKYETMAAEQNNQCAICSRPETEKHPASNTIQKLVVDHDHATGKVRGLLCTKHNKAIGLMEDSPELLEAAARYLRKAL